MIAVDWILLALIGGFVAAAGTACLFEWWYTQAEASRGLAGQYRRVSHRPGPRGLWSMAEAAWVGGRGPRHSSGGAVTQAGRGNFALDRAYTAGLYDVQVRFGDPDSERSRRPG